MRLLKITPFIPAGKFLNFYKRLLESIFSKRKAFPEAYNYFLLNDLQYLIVSYLVILTSAPLSLSISISATLSVSHFFKACKNDCRHWTCKFFPSLLNACFLSWTGRILISISQIDWSVLHPREAGSLIILQVSIVEVFSAESSPLLPLIFCWGAETALFSLSDPCRYLLMQRWRSAL